MPSLTKLIFHDSWALRDGARSFEALSRLQHLNVQDCFFGHEATALSSLVYLTRLEAVQRGATGFGARCVLLTALGPLQQLRHLVISSDFKEADPVSLFSVLGTLQHLTHLEFQGPQLPAGALAAMFSTSQGDAGAACLPRLQCLQVHTGFDEEDSDEEEQEEWQASGGSISSSDIGLLARSCPELHSLTIYGYPVEDAGLLHLSGLTSLTTLKLRVVMTGVSCVYVGDLV
jgi:hypothetical protein